MQAATYVRAWFRCQAVCTNLRLPRPLTPCVADWCERGGRVCANLCPVIRSDRIISNGFRLGRKNPDFIRRQVDADALAGFEVVV